MILRLSKWNGRIFSRKQNIVNINLLASTRGMDYSFYVIDLYTHIVMDVFETISISDDEELWHCKHARLSGWSNCIKAFPRCFFFFHRVKKKISGIFSSTV